MEYYREISTSNRFDIVHKLQFNLQGNKIVTKPAFHKHMQCAPYFSTCALCLYPSEIISENNLFD